MNWDFKNHDRHLISFLLFLPRQPSSAGRRSAACSSAQHEAWHKQRMISSLQWPSRAQLNEACYELWVDMGPGLESQLQVPPRWSLHSTRNNAQRMLRKLWEKKKLRERNGVETYLEFVSTPGEDNKLGFVRFQPLHISLEAFQGSVFPTMIHRDANCRCKLIRNASSLPQ